MYPIPAIDIRGGQCVRLLRGDFSEETVYGDPIAQARLFANAGARMLHIVDLDAARGGSENNEAIISEIVEQVSVPIQVGGGVRDDERVEALLDSGVTRVILGTLAVKDPDAARALALRHPGQIVAGFDHRSVIVDGVSKRFAAVNGWLDTPDVELLEAAERIAGAPFAGIVVTDISRDGTLSGPDLDGYRELLEKVTLPIIASGGVGSLGDLICLSDLVVGAKRLDAVVVGRALLAGAFTLEEAIQACDP